MDKKDIFIPCIISSIIFIINPLLGILFLISVMPFIKKKDNVFYVLFLLMSLFLGLINTTRSFDEGDLVSYLVTFESATRLDLLSFLKTLEKEPAYYIFMFFTNRISNVNFKIFILVNSSISYYFYFISIFKINKKLYINNSNQLFAFLIASLFFTLFSLSAHLMRQFIATSIFLYFLVNRLFYKRNYWWLFLIALLCHTSVILFLPLIFIKKLGEKVRFQNLLKIVFIPAFIIIIFTFFNSLFVSIGGPFSYISNRISESSFDDGGEIQLVTIIFTVILMTLSFITIYFKKRNNCGWIYFNHLVIITCFFVLTTQINYPLISYRYSYFIFFFFPVVFSHYIRKRYFNDAVTIIKPVLAFSLVLFFGYMLENGPFNYSPLLEIITNSVFYYF
jgi:hypothetical protein